MNSCRDKCAKTPSSLLRIVSLSLTTINISVTFYRNFVVDIHTKAGQLLSRGSAVPVGGSGGGGGADYSGILQELRDGLNHVRREMQSTTAKLNQVPGGAPGAQVQCPDVQGCVSTTLFMVFMGAQLLVIIGYLMYR